MQSRNRLVLGAAALLALLAALVAVARLAFDRPAEKARAVAVDAARALPFRPADVSVLEIAPRVGAPVRLEAPGSRARLALLGRLAAVRVVSTRPADPAALAAAGLSPPVSRVTVELQGGRTLRLDVGDENAFDRTRFARAGGEILIVSGLPPEAVDPAPMRRPDGPGGG